MLATSVIGLREGLEAALIVGIIAAFLRHQGRRDLIRWVFVGVGTAAVLCVAAGVALDVYSRDLPQRQQEGLETVIGALAVGMVTYMVVWMKRHSRELKGQLETMATGALGDRSRGDRSRAARAMVLMAFLAVLREGIETVIFLLAVFDQSAGSGDAAVGAVLGILVAVALGYGIYRGAVRVNLSRFFRATGFVLVLVAAGLVVNALHTAHEAGWLDIGQANTVDLTWLVDPGSVQSSLLTGMLGLQPRPVVVELIGWLVYLVPVAAFVAWPPGRAPSRNSLVRAFAAAAGVLALAALVLAVLAPSAPAQRPVTAGARVVDTQPGAVQVSLAGSTVTGHDAGRAVRAGVDTEVYTAARPGQLAATLPSSVSYARVAALNGGRLPIGLQPRLSAPATLRYTDRVLTTVWVTPRTLRVVDVRSVERVSAAVVAPDGGTFALGRPVRTGTTGWPAGVVSAASTAARAEAAALDRRALFLGLAWTAGALAVASLAGAAFLAFAPRKRRTTGGHPHPSRELVAS